MLPKYGWTNQSFALQVGHDPLGRFLMYSLTCSTASHVSLPVSRLTYFSIELSSRNPGSS